MGLCLAMRIVTNRLIVSLSPRTSLAIEKEAQDIANAILGIKREAHHEPGSRCLLLSQRFAIANSAFQTRQEWEEACRNIVASAAVATRDEWEGECRVALEDIHMVDRTRLPDEARPQWQGICEEHIARSVTGTADEYWTATLEAPGAKGPNGYNGQPVTRPGVVQKSPGRTSIPKWVFERWCNTLGRKTT